MMMNFLPLDVDHGITFYSRRQKNIQRRLNEIKCLVQKKILGREVMRVWDEYGDIVCDKSFSGNWICSGVTKHMMVEIAIGLGQCGLLVVILENLCKNITTWSRGLPDLILWSRCGVVDPTLSVDVGTNKPPPRDEDFFTPECNYEDHEEEESEIVIPDNDRNECLLKGVDSNTSSTKVYVEDPCIEVKLVEVKSKNDVLSSYQKAWIDVFMDMNVKLFELCNVSS